MAKDKNTFIAYSNWVKIFDELLDEEAGKLAKHLFRYVNDMNPEAPDKLTKMMFIPMQTILKLDLKKWEIYQEKQKENGLKGGRPRKIETQITQPFIIKPKKADIVIEDVDVDVDVIEDEKKNIEKSEIPIFNFKKSFLDLGVEEKILSDWLKVRSKKSASNTETSFTKIKNQILQSGFPANECIKICVEKDWKGFEADWLNDTKEKPEYKHPAAAYTQKDSTAVSRF